MTEYECANFSPDPVPAKLAFSRAEKLDGVKLSEPTLVRKIHKLGTLYLWTAKVVDGD